MTTSHSPLRALKAVSDNIAKLLKQVERGENPAADVGGKIAAARKTDRVKFGVVMDDKVLIVEMTWAKVREMSEVSTSEWILKYMREQRDAS